MKLKRQLKVCHWQKKIEVLAMLEKELFAARFKSLLKEFRESARKYPITIEEITGEVESVRGSRLSYYRR
ncbi:MAG: hypothetical protein A3G39_01850 [Deltaproteobacteria bacterium RIFCSPLOWO2_12_FULL_43_16]|nr:MAG: hypothetical protein A2Z89_05570 [Deltaproteobacteria bacterium GWA2_43_19]OGQ11506.1 MAG: hypothetical protein A3D30_09490 [Deltaproteobacteria bacterium RIFCSPHIGHO2_02_FULL_43_33]OGQ60647.1 MAG: hypothetical protein A3G39_01850 [Deltaproteobacteria bacterium RIFCSPLOWO2_12_FULL_43_16]HBR17287.1 hypothetical protein [Deltaproteobacteria bacterium]